MGIAFNESYILRAFLQNNPNFKIVFWLNYLFYRHRRELLDKMPLAEKNFGRSI